MQISLGTISQDEVLIRLRISFRHAIPSRRDGAAAERYRDRCDAGYPKNKKPAVDAGPRAAQSILKG
jgi:hypothetical protein